MAENLNQEIIQLLNKELTDYRGQQIKVALNLLAEGNTVPFIARYRKEMTGSLDEVQLREIEERYNYLENLEKRKQEVLRLIDEQGKLTEELAQKIQQAVKMQKVEDLYRPYKQKRRTKATIAKENGLEPLAKYFMSFPQTGDVYAKAGEFVNEAVASAEAALQGAHEIVAEQISDNPDFRTWIRKFTQKNGIYQSKVKDADKDEKGVYEMYYEFAEPINKMVSHRVLASNRGEKEEILKVAIVVEEEKIFAFLENQLVENNRSITVEFVREAYKDSYKRFIGPAIEREIRNELTEEADEQAINIFGENLRNLLLQPPLKGKIVLGFDPAYRTGCKLAVVDATGKVLAIEVIYPHKPASQAKRQAAGSAFQTLIQKYGVEMVAIGNGTASRESELFVAEQLKQVPQEVFYVIVNEAGASVYSASDIARTEFPNLQVEERSAVSIARRLQDPLSELVKIDPKAVGVGQYQHDVAQKRLSERLDFVVETAVNQVGVNVNTASPQLLQYVSGLNKTTAQNIVNYREENGAFTSRPQLKKVPRLGPKAYEQAIGFLRIPGAKNILDTTAIHPESYASAKEILKLAEVELNTLGSSETTEKIQALQQTQLQELGIGKETIKDILQALVQPGRDMRDEMSAPLLRQDVLTMEDLQPGMELQGTVRNVIDFGAFVDIGVKQDGLVHISKLSKNYVKHPTDIVSVGDVVTVWVEAIDVKKGRISLTMIQSDKND
ncbi:Tex family protein [Enterococcus dongliensis]|uniref:Tex family protein n=1 Tax=Enterococcus dongliensis TaxID=2559925 RepID=A0AAP5NKC9_9ENTE|nr:Tex family protein [Enterococcus dongliensis]MDT2595876.1 Tex family protein [Enterococcus dongliensis]MDT2602863.1 Tex family protein [Enterococcus dongliensis]MDT2633943.1 Tex family protein [Enterococcus dongliensis]MDT2637295.1 Tex family protein [Enterococcus dongliensis]MDT2639635.1 Tex family protein [Enterococcus dongliensis]